MLSCFQHGGGSIARGDDYPQRFKNGRIWVDADDWGQYVRECTSFVAYRLSTVNGLQFLMLMVTQDNGDIEHVVKVTG